MNLSDWANLAEIVSALAVVISLLYVGYQINLNTKEIRVANRQELVSRAHSATLTWATSPELIGALVKASRNDELSDEERLYVTYATRAVLYDVQEAFLLHEEGRLSSEYWKTRSSLIKAYLASDVAKQIYREQKAVDVLHQAFVDWVDKTIDDNAT